MKKLSSFVAFSLTSLIIGLYLSLGMFPWLSSPSKSSLEERFSSLPLRPPLVELSGLTHHLTRPDLYWSHNDSLDQARLFLIHASGELIETHHASPQTPGVNNVDWEAISATHFDVYDGDRVLYVADSGNNFHWRDHLVIYGFREPTQPAEPLQQIRAYPYRFPYQLRAPPRSDDPLTGRCLDSEALFWWHDELFLISKCVSAGPTALWHLPRQQLSSPQGAPPSQVTLSYITLLPIKKSLHPLHERVTDAAVYSADPQNPQAHDWLAVLTYRSVWFFELIPPTSEIPPLIPHPLLRFSCPLTDVDPQPIRQAEALEWVLEDPPAHLKQTSPIQKIIIFTEGRGVHDLYLSLERLHCMSNH